MYATLFYGLTNQPAAYTGPQYNDGLPVQTSEDYKFCKTGNVQYV